jgi:hypothetical protein
MDLISIFIVLIIVGVCLYLVNVYVGPKMAPPILTILNVAVVIVVVLWLLRGFGVFAHFPNLRV